jgi:hypothetical protein
MLARRTTLRHPLGGTIETPLLIPSFTSKGFPFFRDSKALVSVTTKAIELLGPQPSLDWFLISAYDLHHGHFRNPERFFGGKRLVIVDSGGYELLEDFDSTEPRSNTHVPKAFSRSDYSNVLDGLASDVPFMISNYDWAKRGSPLKSQVRQARRLFETRPASIHSFIAKPPKKGDPIDVEELISLLDEMQSFHVLGLTEKDLGDNLVDRLRCVGQIRHAMDRKKLFIPIHIWGGLDPVITPLYFFAGAELFDGVSWLRYAYLDGTACYRDACSVLSYGLATPMEHARALALGANLIFLRTLRANLQSFVVTGGTDFSVFNHHGEPLRRAYDVMRTEIPDLAGGV